MRGEGGKEENSRQKGEEGPTPSREMEKKRRECRQKKESLENLKTISRSFYRSELLYSTVTDLALQTRII